MLEKKRFQPIKSKDVCYIYNLLYSKGYISFPLTSEAEYKIESLVSSINSKYFGHQIYSTAEEKAVAYLYFIIKDHPFTDGNKRSAVLVFEVVCDLNNLKPDYKDFSLDELAVFIEENKVNNYKNFIKQISKVLFYPT